MNISVVAEAIDLDKLPREQQRAKKSALVNSNI